MGDLLRDLRLAFRQALKSPGFTLTAVITLALGIGAATMIFSNADAVLLRPLPFHEQERLLTVWGEVEQRNQRYAEVSIQDFTDWRERNQVFSDLALVPTNDNDVALTGGAEPLHVRVRLTSDHLLAV